MGEADEQPATLEFWLSRATDPYRAASERERSVRGFCERVNDELEGPAVACRLLAHKMHSPHEDEALNALEVVEACVQSCGHRFHNEVAKFRFLNELIKMLSPKYMGEQTGDRVKQRTTELLYSWKTTLRHLPKLRQAYEMLREQKVIAQDPTYMDQVLAETAKSVSPPKPVAASFEDEEKSKLLAGLLKSNNPDDLQSANRLIKSMVKAEDAKLEKQSKRDEHLSTAANNAKLLTDLMAQYRRDQATVDEADLIRELAASLLNLRPTLFRYAGEAAESNEDALSEVLVCNDEVNRCLELYKTRVEPHLPAVAVDQSVAAQATTSAATHARTLLDLTTDKAALSSEVTRNGEANFSLSSDDVSLLGAATPVVSRRGDPAADALADVFGSVQLSAPNYTASLVDAQLQTIASLSASASEAPPAADRGDAQANSALDQLSTALMQENLPTGAPLIAEMQRIRQKVPMRELQQTPSPVGLDADDLSVLASGTAAPANNAGTPHSCATEPAAESLVSVASSGDTNVRQATALDNVQVALEDIQPAERLPLTLIDRDGMKLMFCFLTNRPRPNVCSGLFNISSTAPTPAHSISIQVTARSDSVPLKLQPASNDKLPRYNPIQPPTHISQILLVESNGQEKISLDYALNYAVDSGGITKHAVSGSFEFCL